MSQLNQKRSAEIFAQSRRRIPGGVNSPVRAFQAVDRVPVVAKSAHGAYLTDEDGNTYIDYICSWGPLIFGHSPEFLREGLAEAVERGVTCGLPTAIELEMAKFVSEAYPAAEMIRMVNSGTEATMSAIRAARGFTGRDKLIKFEGCYHGHSDTLLVKSGSGTLTFGVPTSPGIPNVVVADTLVCPYNDLAAVEEMFARQGEEIACVIVEPIAGNMGLIPGERAFLEGLSRVTKKYGAVLIFDEVISGFRASFGGAAQVYGVTPDMVCFGKIIGSGLPVGAYAGRREIMEMISPAGPVYQAGTLSGNPLAMYLGLKGLRRLKERQSVYAELESKAERLARGFRENLERLGLEYTVNQFGSLLCLFFTGEPLRSYDDVKGCDLKMYSRYFGEMLDRGILLPPAQFECMFLSLAHSEADLERTVEANYAALRAARESLAVR